MGIGASELAYRHREHSDWHRRKENSSLHTGLGAPRLTYGYRNIGVAYSYIEAARVAYGFRSICACIEVQESQGSNT